MPGRNMITPEDLLPLIGAPDAPVLIDVCIDDDFALDPRLIPGAFRHPFADIEALAPNLASSEVVIICQKGLKLSQGAAALLRAQGVDANALAGGMVGWAALECPATPAAALPKQRIVVAEGPQPDALAALWLVKRFARIDAQILFVTEDTVDAVADRFNATHLTTFSSLQTKLCLTQPSLAQIAKAVTGGAPEMPGLATMLTGLRALHPDDLSYVTATLPLFDALHRAFCDASDTQTQTGDAT